MKKEFLRLEKKSEEAWQKLKHPCRKINENALFIFYLFNMFCSLKRWLATGRWRRNLP